jgi:hypothetical protein
MAVLAPPVQVVASGAPPFVQVASGAPPFVATSGLAPPIMLVDSGAPPITLFNADGSLWAGGGGAAVGGAALLTGETDGFAADFLHAVDAERVAVKTAGTVVSSGLSFFTNAGTSSKWVYNAAGVLVNVPAGQLALDYDPVTHAAKGLLVEPQATNLALRSSAFDDAAAWPFSGATISANASAAPDGTLTGDKIQEDAANSAHYAYQAVTVSNGSYTLSVFLKAAERTWAWLKFDASATVATYFNLNTGTLGTVGAGHSATITSVGNGWYRCSITLTAVAGTNYAVIGPTTSDNLGAYLGTVGSGIYVWGAQAEAGTVATSYIPTTSASVTRAADQVSVTPASINYSATAGSWWVDMNLLTAANGLRIIGYTTTSNYPISIFSATAFQLYDGVGAINKTVADAIGSHKLAAAFASGDRALTADGLAPGTDATAGIALGSPGASIGFGFNPASTVNQINGYIRKLRYVPRRKSNAELQSETA